MTRPPTRRAVSGALFAAWLVLLVRSSVESPLTWWVVAAIWLVTFALATVAFATWFK